MEMGYAPRYLPKIKIRKGSLLSSELGIDERYIFVDKQSGRAIKLCG